MYGAGGTERKESFTYNGMFPKWTGDINEIKYRSMYMDHETKNYHMGVVYYDVSIGRPIQENPGSRTQAVKYNVNVYKNLYKVARQKKNSEKGNVAPGGNGLLDPLNPLNPVRDHDSGIGGRGYPEILYAPTVKEAAAMADHIYKDIPLKNDKDLSGNRELRTVAGWRLIDIWSEGTVKMGIYIRDDDDWKNPSGYALVFKGTSNIEDWADNLAAYKTNFAPNMNTAMRYGRIFSNAHSGSTITFIGHSKGGGEAIAAAVNSGKNAITFNAANFAFDRYSITESGRRGIINNFYVKGEVLSGGIGVAAVGGDPKWFETQFWVYKTYTTAGRGGTIKEYDGIKNHGMSAIFKALGME